MSEKHYLRDIIYNNWPIFLKKYQGQEKQRPANCSKLRSLNRKLNSKCDSIFDRREKEERKDYVGNLGERYMVIVLYIWNVSVILKVFKNKTL